MQKDMKINYMILRNQVIVNFDSKTFTVNAGSDEYETVLTIIKNSSLSPGDPNLRSLQELVPILDPQKVISNAVPDGLFVVHKGRIYSEGQPVSGYIGQKLLTFVEQGLPYMPLFNFWRKIKDNPSQNSRDQLYRFLESCLIPITEDGNFIAYKAVKKDMTDHHSGKFKYALNQPATMPREQVVDSPNHACGPGLHVGSYKYATGMYRADNSILLEVEVNPADVVSVPIDHSSQKLRAWRVLPVAICEGEYTSPVVITKKEKVTPKTTASVEPMESDGSFLIGRDRYVSSVIDVAAFDGIHASGKFKEIIALRPSKASSAVKNLVGQYGTLTNCVRFLDGEAKCYAAKYAKTSDDEKVTNTYVVFVPQGHTFVYASAASSVTDENKFLKTITVGLKEYKGEVVGSFKLDDKITNQRSLSRSKMPMALQNLDSNSDIRRCIRGVDASGMSVFIIDIGKDFFITYQAV